MINAFVHLEFPPNMNSLERKRFWREKVSKFLVLRNCLYKKGETLRKIPFCKKREGVLKELHDGMGHGGRDVLASLLRKKYWWPQVTTELNNYLNRCQACQFFKQQQRDVAFTRVEPADLFETWGIDFVGPLPPGRKNEPYILTAVKHATRWPLAKAVVHADAKTAAQFIYEDIFCVFGPSMQ